jgi:hypothetical protein
MTDEQLDQLFQAIRDKIAAGNVGPPGDKGDKGDKGPMGPIGPAAVVGRRLLTGPESYRIGVGGDFPTLAAFVSEWSRKWDAGGNAIVANLIDDQAHDPLTHYGLLPGQIGPHGFVIRSSSLGRSSIRARTGSACVEIAYGAQLTLEYLTLDGGTNAPCNDLLMIGQGSKVVMRGETRMIQNSTYNWISMYQQASCDIYGNIYIQGTGQCFATIDGASTLNWANDSRPNSLAIFLEAGQGRDRPYWQHSFLNPRGASVITHQLVDYHSGAEPLAHGYKYKVDKGGILDVYLQYYSDDHTGLDRLPGSANTFGGVQGFIF